MAALSSFAPAYEVECRRFEKSEWDTILAGFRDANLYQTWSYAGVRWGEEKLSHLVLRDRGTVVGGAQVVLVTLPMLRGGLAYVKWGPLWMPRGREAEPRVFRELLRALRQAYARERGYFLRVTPWEFENPALQSMAQEERFGRNLISEPRTALLNLVASIEELRMSLTRHWRANLKKAEANGLEILEGPTEDLIDQFTELYRQMRARKGRRWIPPIYYLRQVQRGLSAEMKARVSICLHEGQPVAGLIVSALGEKALAWFAAMGDLGNECRGSYLLQWRAIQRLKATGVRVYDLGGINEVTHPGTTQFKLGLCGKLGRVLPYLGEFEACDAWTSRMVLGATDPWRMALLRAQQFYEEHRHARTAAARAW